LSLTADEFNAIKNDGDAYNKLVSMRDPDTTTVEGASTSQDCDTKPEK